VQEKVEELVPLVEAPVAEVAAAIPAEAPLPAEEPAPAPEESPLLELAEPAASEGTASETHATLGTVRGGTMSKANGGV
jgi:hypothetical protein